MRIFSLFLCYIVIQLFFVDLSVAQDRLILDVVVTDNIRQPLFMATVVLRDINNRLLAVVETNEEGKASISVTAESNPSVLIVSLVGYYSYRKEINFKNGKVLNVGEIVLSPNTTLDSVVVTAPKLIRTTRDAFVYDVEKDPKAKEIKIVNLLEKLPFIEIGFNNEISIFGGSKKIAYLLNGKQSPLLSGTKLTMKSITGLNIKYIELLPNPPGNYINFDAVINIVTRTSLFEGFLFGLEETININKLNGGFKTAFDIASNIKNLSFVFKTNIQNSFRLSDNYRYNYRQIIGEETSNFSKVETESFSNTKNTSLNFQFFGSYSLNKKSALNFQIQYGKLNTFNKEKATNTYASAPEQNFISVSNINTGSRIFGGNISFSTQKLREKGFNINYFWIAQNHKNDELFNLNRIHNSFISSTFKTESNQLHKVFSNNTIKINNNNTVILEESYTFSMVFTRGSLSKYNEDENIWEIDHNKNNYLRNLQHNVNLDFSYNLKAGLSNIAFRLGNSFCSNTYYLKENDQQRIQNNYWTFNPSITYSILTSGAKNITLRYNRSSKLPGPEQINPYYDQVNPLYIKTGNPNLKQEKADNLLVSIFSQKLKTTWGISFNYSHVWNSIEAVNYVDYNGANVYTYDNIGSKDIFSTKIMCRYTIIWGFEARSQVIYTKTKARVLENIYSIDNINAVISANYRFNRRLLMSVSGNLEPSRSNSDIQSGKVFYNLSSRIEISGKSKTMKFNWGVRVNAIEKSSKTITTQDIYSGYMLTSQRINPGRSIEIVVSYSLGKIK